MKTLTLSLLTLLLTTALHAQNAPAPARDANAADPAAPKIARDLTLGARPLPDVVAMMEEMIHEFRGPVGEAATMPNILFGPGTEKLELPANLRMRDVTPVQALTLVAAATGCTLQPITALREDADSRYGTDKIIGYQFMLPPSRVTSVGGGSQLRALYKPATSEPLPIPGQVSPPEPLTSPAPVTTARTSGGSPFLGAGDDITPSGTFPVGPTQLGAPVTEDPTMRGVTFITPNPVHEDTVTVRIYALGSVMRGTGDEMKEQQENLQTLMAEALDHANLGGVAPVLSFHNASKALIVKGIAAHHDIVAQIITAMKENESADSVKVGEPIITR